MADKNLHDIKIDELETKKKTPLKNILTLLALLFIILVISVVITKLILNTDDSESIDSNYTTVSERTEEVSNSNMATGAAALAAGAAGTIAVNSATESVKNVANTTAESTKNAVKDASESAKDTAKNTSESIKNTTDATVDSAKNAVKAPNIDNALKERDNGSSKTKVTLRDHQPVKTVKELKHTTTKSNTATKSSSTKSASYSNSDKVIVKRNASTHTSTSKHSVGSTVSHLSNGFYIKVGTFKNTTNIIKAIKKTGLNYQLVKADNGLTRAYIGRFSTKSSAKSNLNRAKTVSPSAFIYEEK